MLVQYLKAGVISYLRKYLLIYLLAYLIIYGGNQLGLKEAVVDNLAIIC